MEYHYKADILLNCFDLVDLFTLELAACLVESKPLQCIQQISCTLKLKIILALPVQVKIHKIEPLSSLHR